MGLVPVPEGKYVLYCVFEILMEKEKEELLLLNSFYNCSDVNFVCKFFVLFTQQLISAVDPVFLKLTRVDDVIYQTFREDFPDLDVRIVNDDELKSKEGKEVIVMFLYNICYSRFIKTLYRLGFFTH